MNNYREEEEDNSADFNMDFKRLGIKDVEDFVGRKASNVVVWGKWVKCTFDSFNGALSVSFRKW